MKIVHAIRGAFRESHAGRVADYQVIVCHDETCPGLNRKGHMLNGDDRSHHHDYRFLADARTQEEIFAEVLANEEYEAAGSGAVSLELPKS